MKKLIASGINKQGVPWKEWLIVKDTTDPKERVIKDDDGYNPKRKNYYHR